MKTWREMMMEAKKEITLLQAADVKGKLDRGEEMVLIDCREAEEYQGGRIPGAVLIPRGVIEMTMEQRGQDRGKPIVVYCAGGGRSAMAAHALKQMGYRHVASMEGGFGSWRQFGLPIEK